MRIPPHPKAFTLIELLVTIGITAILAMLFFGAGSTAIRKANQSGSASNLRQITQAFHAYCAENQGTIPGEKQNTPYILDSTTDGTDPSKAGGPNTYLHRDLVPYLDNRKEVWKAPGDKAFYHNYYYGLATSYGTGLGSFTGPSSYTISNTKLVAFQGDSAASKKPIFADIGWEMTSRYWNGYDLGDGYNVAFLDGHVAYYKRTTVQGRYRSDW